MPERCVTLRAETKEELDKFHRLARRQDVYRSSDVLRIPELERAAKEAMKALSKDLIQHTGIDEKAINAVSFKIYLRRPGSLTTPTGDPTMSEVVRFCEGCTCHYGIYVDETQTCEYIGSGVEEGCLD